ncbi:MAG: hypothetical protein IT320_22805 [Anaerolineae bacterium]|nr:hypothetical protein [Anaerolineae bacterium]
MLKDYLLFIGAVARFLVATLGLLYRGAKVVQYAFMAWLVYVIFRRVSTAAFPEISQHDLPRISVSADYARQTAPQYEVEGVYLS